MNVQYFAHIDEFKIENAHIYNAHTVEIRSRAQEKIKKRKRERADWNEMIFIRLNQTNQNVHAEQKAMVTTFENSIESFSLYFEVRDHCSIWRWKLKSKRARAWSAIHTIRYNKPNECCSLWKGSMNYLHQQKGKHECAITHRPTVRSTDETRESEGERDRVRWRETKNELGNNRRRRRRIGEERGKNEKTIYIIWVTLCAMCAMCAYIQWWNISYEKYVHLMNFTVTHGRITFREIRLKAVCLK